MLFTVNDGIRRDTIEASNPAEATMAFVARHGLAPDEHDFVTASPVPEGALQAATKEILDDVECPSCGGADVDLAETIQGPLLECQECGAAFDPEEEGNNGHFAERSDKLHCPLVGTDGNVFSIIGTVARCLRDAGQRDRARDWLADATASTSYDQVIEKVFTYVDPL